MARRVPDRRSDFAGASSCTAVLAGRRPAGARVLTAIAGVDFATVEKQFTDDMKAALPPGALAAMWAKLLNQAGAYQSCSTDPRVRRIDDKDMVITPCEFERTTIDIQFAFDSASRISGLVFRPSVRTAAAYTLPSYAKPSSFVEREVGHSTYETIRSGCHRTGHTHLLWSVSCRVLLKMVVLQNHPIQTDGRVAAVAER